MTDEQMRIRLAEWAGYDDIQEEDVSYVPHVAMLIANPPKEKINETGRRKHEWVEIPNYPNDLNAVHKLEMKLDGVDQSTYEAHLLDVVTPEDEVDNEDRNFYWFVVHASANQRCEALLKTLGLWEDDDDK